MSDLLAIGASGLKSYSAALDAVGDNVANAQTEGFTRRTARLAEIRLASTPSLLYSDRVRFDGSEPVDVVRAVDAFRTLEARVTLADASSAAALARWLATGETALGDRIGPALATAFANGDRLAADPQGAQPRIAFVDGLSATAGEIRVSAEELARVATGVGDAATADVASVNADLSDLATINLMIRRQQPGTASFAELSDQRDALVDALCSKLGATAIVAPDGSVEIRSGATVLLSVGTVTPLALTIATDGRLSFATSGGPLNIATGALAGLAAAADDIADRRAGLDTLASDFVTAINNWQAGGTTPAGAVGGPLLAITGSSAVTLAMATTDPDDIATVSGTATNGNALALATVRSVSGLEAGAALLVAQQAAATSAARHTETMTGNRRDTAAAARDAVEGVDLDREAGDLLRFQQAYQAAARVIQTARAMLDDILGLFR